MEEHDVFISYAHLDNLPLRPNEPDTGWVSRFNYVLNSLLSQELGRKAKIWRDPSMDSNNYIWDTIEENLLKSFILVSIVSPSYLNSKWCPRELRTYLERKKPIRFGNKSRIFKVLKQPVKQNQISQDLQDLFTEVLARKFFEEEQVSGKRHGYDPEYGDKWKQSFYKEMDQLVQEIAEMLEDIYPAAPAVLPEAVEPSALKPFLGMTIYMCEASPNLLKDYIEIRRDFIKRGAKVLPSLDAERPETIEEYAAAMRSDLEQCKLIVHIIGSEDSEYSEVNQQSLAQLQMSIAAAYQAEAKCPRLIWLPQDIEPTTERHREFIAQLPEITSPDVDLLRTSLELKTEMESILAGKPKPRVEPVFETVKPTIYVLYDASDAESVNRLVGKLFKNGCEVWKISQTSEAGGVDLIEMHKWYLLNCSAALVYWNNAQEFRIRALMSEFQRAKNIGREQAFDAKGVFIDGNSSNKDGFMTHETLLRTEDDFSAFLAKLGSRG